MPLIEHIQVIELSEYAYKLYSHIAAERKESLVDVIEGILEQWADDNGEEVMSQEAADAATDA